MLGTGKVNNLLIVLSSLARYNLLWTLVMYFLLGSSKFLLLHNT